MTGLPVVMRPVVRFVTRSPVAPNNPMPSQLPQIEALIEERQLLKRIRSRCPRRLAESNFPPVEVLAAEGP